MLQKNSNFNLRNISPELMDRLKKHSSENKTSVNSLILSFIEKGLGFTQPKKNKYHDLDFIAGTWTEEDEKEFYQNIKAFEEIDEGMWL